jgi:hypothetical protein
MIIPSSEFTWNPATKTFSAEASDLDHKYGTDGVIEWVIKNGEIGFWMESIRTGRVVWFARRRHRLGSDGDLLAHEYVSDEVDVRCVIFND